MKMKPLLVSASVVLVFLMAGWAQAGKSAKSQRTDAYVIGPGDVLWISVWKDEALTRQVVVLPDGMISFPLIGEFKAAGKTLTELKKQLEKKIKHYMPEPVFSISIDQVTSMIIYVIGKVKQAGRFPINASVNVLQALSMAGGLDKFASRNNIKVFREQGGKTLIFDFKYDDVVKGRNLKQNIRLKRGDVVVVP